MRCKNCPYEDYDYQENYPTCKLFGDNDDYIYENAKGELGCRYNQRGLQKFIREREEDEKVIVQQMGDFAKWCEEHPNPRMTTNPNKRKTYDPERKSPQGPGPASSQIQPYQRNVPPGDVH